jgi:arylsulfatase A-like enzyme
MRRMAMKSLGMGSRRAVLALGAILVGAGLGVAVSLRWTVAQIWTNGYAGLGFRRTLWSAAQEASSRGALYGALVGASVAFAAGVALLLSGERAGSLPSSLARALRERRNVLRAWLAICALGFAAIWGLLLGQGWLGRTDALGVSLLVVLLCASVSFAARRTRARPAGARDAEAFCAAFLASAVLLFVGGFWINRRAAEQPIALQPVLANALLAVAALATFFVVRGRVARAERGRTLERALLAVIGVLALAPLALAALAPWLARPTLQARSPRNVLLIGIDTLRADHATLSSADGGRELTPHLAALASRGTRFDAAVSQSPWTMPAFASILTGRYPHEHGAISLAGSLRPEEVTLAEVLREAGWATRAVVSHEYVDRWHGFAQGFERFDQRNVKGHEAITSADVTDAAIAELSQAGSQPLFLFVHYFDPHYEYRDHAAIAYADSYQGWLRGQLHFDNLVKNRQLVGPAELEFVKDLYAEEVAFTDREVGRLLEFVRAQGLEEDTLVAVVADHGEEFLDHGNFGHTTTLYEELVHVPLVIAGPGVPAGARFGEPVETRALFGTLLELCGVDYAPRSRERSLLRAPEGSPEGAKGGAEAMAFSTVWLPDAKPEWGKRFELASLRVGPLKLIRDVTRGERMLFDLANDPREQHDLWQEIHAGELDGAAIVDLRARAEEMSSLLDAWIEEMKARATGVPRHALSGAMEARLRALGYL